VEALIRVHFDLVSDDRGRIDLRDAGFSSNTSSASVEGLAVDHKPALLVQANVSGPRCRATFREADLSGVGDRLVYRELLVRQGNNQSML